MGATLLLCFVATRSVIIQSPGNLWIWWQSFSWSVDQKRNLMLKLLSFTTTIVCNIKVPNKSVHPNCCFISFWLYFLFLSVVHKNWPTRTTDSYSVQPIQLAYKGVQLGAKGWLLFFLFWDMFSCCLYLLLIFDSFPLAIVTTYYYNVLLEKCWCIIDPYFGHFYVQQWWVCWLFSIARTVALCNVQISCIGTKIVATNIGKREMEVVREGVVPFDKRLVDRPLKLLNGGYHFDHVIDNKWQGLRGVRNR